MKVVLQIVVIALLAFVAEYFMAWWTIAIAACIGGYFLKSRINFLAGAIAIALLWLVVALVADNGSSTQLAEKVAQIFSVSKPILLAITCLLGGLVGGLGAMTGARLRPEPRRTKYY